MLQLHHYPGNASLVPHLLLEEIGVRFELVPVDRARQAHKSPAYLALNPNGLIPVLVDGTAGGEPVVVYETAAVCLHLCERHPEAGLLPPAATRERSHAYQWLAWLANTLHATLVVYFYPERWADGDAGVASVRAHAEARTGALLDLLDAELARTRGSWLAGARYSVLDPYAFVLCRWTRGHAQPARVRPHIGPWLARVLARPATTRAMATEGLAEPWV